MWIAGIGTVACGAASRLRLKHASNTLCRDDKKGRMWSGFSSEIETLWPGRERRRGRCVACGAASRLRLKLACAVGSVVRPGGRMWSGFSSEIETSMEPCSVLPSLASHVERLLV